MTISCHGMHPCGCRKPSSFPERTYHETRTTYDPRLVDELVALKVELAQTKKELANLQTVRVARHEDRPKDGTFAEYISNIPPKEVEQ